MIPNTLLKTKLFIPPLQENLIPRQRLLSTINVEVWRKLVLIKTPPGFGKSTLAIQWAGQADLPVAWLSLDQSDNTYIFTVIDIQ
jgi:ATP/maltotriose-dependent transcriptional regulator MalT